jgi:hypothetical protein
VREVRIDRLTKGTYYAVVVVDGPQGAGPQALLQELAEETQGQDPPEPPGS